jgi:hypothetical protein
MNPMMTNDMISGKWMNKMTGDTIIVKNSVMDGEEMVIMTNKGVLNMSEFSMNYIQVSDEVYDEHGNVVGNEAINIEQIPQQPQNTPALDYSTLTRGLTQQDIHNIQQQVQPITVAPVEDEDTMLIRRILKKVSPPEVKSTIEWTTYPTKQLEMLEMLGVEPNKIVEYFVNQINVETIRKSINHQIAKSLFTEEEYKPQEEQMICEEEVVKPVKRKRITNK